MDVSGIDTKSKLATTPKTNTEYWVNKFNHNIENDQKNYEKLNVLGWHVIILWECELKDNFEEIMEQVISTLVS